MPKGIYPKTKEHIEKLKPSLLKNFEKIKKCGKCGRLIGKKKHICPTKEEIQELVKHLHTKEAKEKRDKIIKRMIESGKIKYAVGKNHQNWKGNKVGYQGLHKWIRNHKPKPKFCERCGGRKKLDLSNISGKYKRDMNDFEYICRSCHIKKDGINKGKKRDDLIRDKNGRFIKK